MTLLFGGYRGPFEKWWPDRLWYVTIFKRVLDIIRIKIRYLKDENKKESSGRLKWITSVLDLHISNFQFHMGQFQCYLTISVFSIPIMVLTIYDQLMCILSMVLAETSLPDFNVYLKMSTLSRKRLYTGGRC